MTILFDKQHPKSLIEAIQLLQNLDGSDTYTVTHYDSSIIDAELQNPVLFRIDKQKRGLEPVTEILYENGFRVVALKLSEKRKWSLYDISLAIIGLWPKAIALLKEKNTPFIYKCNSKLDKLIAVKE